MIIDSFKGEYEFLSNFYEHPIKYKGVTFPTSEHAYQAAKAKDVLQFYDIAHAKTAGHAKKLGRLVTLRDNWEEVKVEVMVEILLEKFKDPKLKQKLIDTYPHELIEGNWWGDTFWGVCKGKGKNKLGIILDVIRRFYMSEENSK